jgi:hypothetical protein
VALNADPATGYYVRFDDRWWQVGGTSVAAPIWAALLALANQERERAGRPPVGTPAPRFCDLATAGAPGFRDITRGGNGAYTAAPGWDYVTGWGSPNAYALVEHLAQGAPAADVGNPIVASTLFPQTPQSGFGAARAYFCARCADARLDLSLELPGVGDYDVWLDTELVHTFTARGPGAATVQIPTVDPRGKLLLLKRRGDQNATLSGVFPATASRIGLRVPFTAAATKVNGFARYRARRGIARFEIRLYDLPEEAEYNITVANVRIGTMMVRRVGEHTLGVARYDTRPRRGAPLTVNPHCAPIIISRRGVIHARIEQFGGPESGCPGR